MTAPPAPLPLSLRVSVTDRCDLRCAYCMPEEGRPLSPRSEILSYEDIAQFVRAVRAAYGVFHVRITGGEPLVRPQLENLIGMLAAEGIRDVALTTNGQLLAQKADALKRAGLGRVNISLDSLRPDVFARITRGGVLQRTLDGIEAALAAGLRPVKLNTVVLRGINDQEAPDLVRFAIGHGCQIRFLELMPIGEAAASFDRLFVSSADTRASLRGRFQLEPLPIDSSSTSRDYRIQDLAGRMTIAGFISPTTEPFCAGCRRLRLTAKGSLIGCLARPQAIPVADLLRNGATRDPGLILAAVEAALGLKRRNSEFAQPLEMVQIGG